MTVTVVLPVLFGAKVRLPGLIVVVKELDKTMVNGVMAAEV